jgi:hypothetical protein
MGQKMARVLLLVCAGSVLLPAAVVQGQILHSEYMGGQQFWIPGGDFVARSGGATPHYVSDPNANAPLSGSAYYFPTPLGSESGGDVQEDWWVQYNVPVSSLPANFNLTGAWGFWVRTQIPSDQEIGGGDHFLESDWLIVNGHPADLSVSNPSEADWQTAVGGATNDDDRVLQDIAFQPNGTRPNWTWLSGPNASTVVTKSLQVIDDMISFRLYEREAGPYNGRVDVIVFANSTDYVPTDSDFLNAVPEPGSLFLLLLGGSMLLRRRV